LFVSTSRVCHIQGDPFKKPQHAKCSQREWERAHGHERQRGGANLGTLMFLQFGIIGTMIAKLVLKYWPSNYICTA